MGSCMATAPKPPMYQHLDDLAIKASQPLELPNGHGTLICGPHGEIILAQNGRVFVVSTDSQGRVEVHHRGIGAA